MDVTKPTHHHVQSISFHLLTPDRIRRLSVRSITSPDIFDNLGHPIRGGLYDPALGPIDKNGRCTTCGLGFFQCPGHFGHVDLAVPVYAPLTFAQMFQLLRLCCLYCHRLRVGPLKAQLCLSKLQLLDMGLLIEAKDLDTLLVQSRGKNSEDGDEGETDRRADVDSIIHRLKVHTTTLRQQYQRETKGTLNLTLIGAVTEYRKQVIAEFLKSPGTSNSCQYCRGYIPTLYRHGGTKIFINPLRKSHQLVMSAKGMDVDSLFKDGNDEGEETDKDETMADQSASENVNENGEIKSPRGMKFLTPMHVYEHLCQLWKNESALLNIIFGGSTTTTTATGAHRRDRTSLIDHRIFFTETLAVPPCRFRPPTVFGEQTFDHPQNSYLVEIIKLNRQIIELRSTAAGNTEKSTETGAPKKRELDRMLIDQKEAFAQLIRTWVSLQEQVNFLFDSSRNSRAIGQIAPPGIKQILEKKEGLFRKHMMGKRVNFAARSVISPDPHLETGEIGVPLVFATRLTYPEPVTDYNVAQLRQVVINGPEVHPGASHVQMEDGSLANLEALSKPARIALANRLCTPSTSSRSLAGGVGSGSTPATGMGIKRVHRHIRNGDIVLMNRQPTLHKPSIMAHRVRVLPGEKTLRMHYANCNTYNADFDGDEMNLHFPQSELARAEAYGIAATAQQYLVPTDGSPLRGLIQDHIVTGVLLTLKDTWLPKDVFQQLLWGSIPEIDLVQVKVVPPAIISPRPLWSGKQLISAVLLNLARGRPPLSFTSGGKIGAKLWGPSHSLEATVTVIQGDLLTGVMDKSQLGASSYGLTHAVYELYGPEGAASLLTTMGRLLTKYDQWVGFTCRMDDLLLNGVANSERRRLIEASHPVGRAAVSTYAQLNGNNYTLDSKLNSKLDSTLSGSAPIDQVRLALEKIVRNDELAKGLDREMKTRTNTLTSQIIDACLPSGQLRPFPLNNMSLMTNSGAKGSMVNFSQITGLLGQQELEGRRVPVMVSGKTLPCFPAWDPRVRAGGYITQRFLTGIRPPEFFFHCMAGREGLIDTAVKTSRSGYLQRCLIKHLESLRVHYDGTVRDGSDGSIVQFQYGEDGLDVTKQKYLDKFDFAETNFSLFLEQCRPQLAWDRVNTEKAIKVNRRLVRRQREGRPAEGDPVLARYPPTVYLGSVSEKFMNSLINHRLRKDGGLDESVFQATLLLKYMRSMVEAGEAVGVVAAQSVGEPSTQMTLNTFHFAGFGAKNVTLGIPRLREIIMTASARIKTPSITVPLRDDTIIPAEELARKMSKLTLKQLIQDIKITERLVSSTTFTRNNGLGGGVAVNLGRRARVYKIQIELMDGSEVEENWTVKLEEEVRTAIENGLVRMLMGAIEKQRKRKTTSSGELVTAGSIVKEGGASSRFNTQEQDEGGEKAGPIPDDSSSDEEDNVGHDGDDGEEGKIHSRKAIYNQERDEDNHSSSDEDNDDDDDEKQDQNGKEQNHLESDDDKVDNQDEKDLESDDDLDVNQRKDYSSSFYELETTSVIIREAKPDSILYQARCIRNYSFDVRRGLVEFDLIFPASHPKILMLDLVERTVGEVIVRQIPGINRVFPTQDETNSNAAALTTEGSNVRALWDNPLSFHHLNLTRLITNDVHAVLHHYGVEAARATIVREVGAVFGVYGISVDARHLYLIADYMTVGGGYRPFNRQGMLGQVSPLLRMTFETTVGFLRTAALIGERDGLGSPSASLVLGKPVPLGTGTFEIRQQL